MRSEIFLPRERSEAAGGAQHEMRGGGGLPSAERTEMDKVQVSRAVARLLRTRRIQRSTDGEDGRVTRLSLSARGRAIYDEIVPLALQLEERFLSVLSRDERERFDALMTTLSQ